MSSAQLQSSGKTYVFPETDDAYDFLFKIVLIGDAGIGKTCIVQRFKHGFYMERHGNTIGVDFMLKTVEVEHKRVKVAKNTGETVHFVRIPCATPSFGTLFSQTLDVLCDSLVGAGVGVGTRL